MRVYAVIPAYRPSERLVPLARALVDAALDGVVVVDDGSGPEHAHVFGALAGLGRVTVLRHAVNLGKGAALKTAFNHVATTAPGAGVVTLDADGQHDLQSVLEVRARLLAEPGALHLGARAFSGDVPWRSLVGNVATRWVLRVLTGMRLTDTQTGLRGLSASFAKEVIALPSQRFEFEMDMLLAAQRSRVPVREHPIPTIYLDGNRSSHFNPFLDSFRIYFLLLRFTIASLVAAVIDNAIFLLVYPATGSIVIGQVAGRTVASAVNYSMARRFVFAAREVRGALPKYAATVVLLGFLSFALIRVLSAELHVPVPLAKIFAETTIYVCSFLIQRHIVFRRSAVRTRGADPGARAGST
jgi:putative flippase GtrA